MGRRPLKHDSPAKKRHFARVGAILKKYRVLAGVTQQELADELDLTTAQYISNIERGLSPPSPELLRAEVELCEIDPRDLSISIAASYSRFIEDELGVSR